MIGLGLGLGIGPPHPATAPPSTIFPDEGFDDAAKFNLTNGGGRINVTGSNLAMTGARGGDHALLETTANAAMLEQLSDGVMYDCVFTLAAGSSGTPSISLKGGTPVNIPTGSPTVQVTAGSSLTEAWRLTGSGNAVSGNVTRTWSGLAITPH